MKPRPSREIDFLTFATEAVQPGNHATWTERRSSRWSCARMRARLEPSQVKAAAWDSFAMASAYRETSAKGTSRELVMGTWSPERSTCARELAAGGTE